MNAEGLSIYFVMAGLVIAALVQRFYCYPCNLLLSAALCQIEISFWASFNTAKSLGRKSLKLLCDISCFLLIFLLTLSVPGACKNCAS